MTQLEFRALPDREKCKLMVQKLAVLKGKPEPMIWGLAYSLLGKKIGIDIKAKAAAAKLAPLHWIEETRRMPNLKRTLKMIYEQTVNPKPRGKRPAVGGQRQWQARR